MVLRFLAPTDDCDAVWSIVEEGAVETPDTSMLVIVEGSGPAEVVLSITSSLEADSVPDSVSVAVVVVATFGIVTDVVVLPMIGD